MSEPTHTAASVSELLAGGPTNWGRWGPDDELGTLNFLTPEVVLRGVACVRQGRTLTLQLPMASPDGDPVFPGRTPSQRYMAVDKSTFIAGRLPDYEGGVEFADDVMICFLQGSTQYDAIGHAWYDDQLYNGYGAATTIGGLRRGSIMATAEKGVAGRGVLLDIARMRGKQALDPGELIELEDLTECAAQQGVEIRLHDVLLVRTGWLGRFYEVGATAFFGDFREPGMYYTPRLVEWFHEMEISNLVTDTMANETNADPHHNFKMTLHGAFIRNLGLAMTEMAALDELAEDCATDGQYDFLYVAAPLKIVEGAGAPVNPVVLK